MSLPRVYISNAFLVQMNIKFKWIMQQEEGFFIPKERKTLERILNLLLCSKLFCNISEKETIKYYKKSMGNKKYDSIQELVYSQSIKDGRLKHEQKYIHETGVLENLDLLKRTQDYSGCYFLSEKEEQCNELSNKTGVLIKGADFNYNNFHEKANLGITPTDHQLEALAVAVHETNAMIVIDPYIFIDSPVHVAKMPNIINAIKYFKNESLKIKFHLTIITSVMLVMN